MHLFYSEKKKLSKAEEAILSKGFELAMFSQAYCAEYANNNTDDVENDDHDSNSIKTLRQMVILGFKRAKAAIPNHFFKLTRSIIRTVKTVFVKALQDLIRFQSCSVCSKEDQDRIRGDTVALLELLEFAITDAEPLELDWSNFNEFKMNNTKEVEKKLSDYFF
jgi:hypothetical protein